MSRKAGTVSEETRARLLETASKEFSEAGFQKASLRSICSKAGVTTGALYFFFEGKDDLMAHVIEPVCSKLLAYVREHYGSDAYEKHQGFFATEQQDYEAALGLYQLIEENGQIASILLDNRQHKTVAAFFDEVVDSLVGYLKSVVRATYPHLLESPQYDEYTLHWLARVQMDAFLGLFELDMDAERTHHQVRLVVRSFRGAFEALLEQSS